MEKLAVIINPISGTESKKRIPELLDQYILPEVFDRQIFHTEYAGHAFELASQAVQNNFDYVVAVGGDGTVNEIARALIHTPVALGIVPMGSGNGLARGLSVPIDVRRALKVIAKKNVTTIDYCKANEYIFFCTCGIGFDALISKRFSEEKRRGGIMYVKNIITEFPKFHPDTYEIILENEVITKNAFMVTFANASQYGNNAFIAPDASMSDGLLDVVVVSPIGPLDVVPITIQMFTKQMTKNHKIQYYLSKKLTLKRNKPGIMHIDGESVQTGETITVEAFHNGLHVIVPQ
jgi:YegS/Rv2252/BmrU family lipid kinase